MKHILACVYFLFSTISYAQNTPLSTLPTYDCKLKKLMTIIAAETILVSPDQGIVNEAMLNDYCNTLGKNCIRKKESALTDDDLSKNLFIIGVLGDFKKWKSFNSPVSLIEKGFFVNNKKFLDKADGFVFVDTNRIIIGGNSIKAVKDAQLALTGGHDILITQHGKITFYGNITGAEFNWFNLQNLKSSNYNQKPHNLFSPIYVSKTFADTINYVKLNKELKTYVQQFLSIYNIKMPVRKVSWYIHSNMQEYGTMSGMFGLTCPGNKSAGFSIRGEIHTNGYNVGLVKHEYSHFLFDNHIPQDNNPAFFIEGCVEYVTNKNDNSVYRQRMIIAKKFRDTLRYADLIISNKDFYGEYSEVNYAVCGIFVKFIVDNFGIEVFKKFCLAENKAVFTKEILGKDFETLTREYVSWLDTQ